ncbi:MAG TPA: hypothetical protein VGR26_02295 [Acidimicrobiales bacterium]|nr:hypothetical protein [Acidimicrobiales bacterium]
MPDEVMKNDTGTKDPIPGRGVRYELRDNSPRLRREQVVRQHLT